jgi:hypothetical protein
MHNEEKHCDIPASVKKTVHTPLSEGVQVQKYHEQTEEKPGLPV